MSWRALLALAVATGVVHPAAAESTEMTAETSSSEDTQKSTRTKAKSKQVASKKSKKSKKKSKKSKLSKKSKRAKLAKAKAKKKKRKLISRTPSKSSLRRTDNMPRGYTWPPSSQMREAEKACQARVDELGIPWKPAKSEGRIVSAMVVEDDTGVMKLGGVAYRSAYRKGPHKLDCQLALALETFGADLYSLGVREITFGSIYRWTNVRVNGETKNILSRHALGIAMDINSFTDDTGRIIDVKKDYPTGDPFLIAIEEAINASGRFRVVLTPKNDPVSHSDHFHVEVKVDYTSPIAGI